jgi:exportin-1
MGLNTLFELLVNVERSNVADEFYQHFFLSLLNDILAVMTDSFHKSGFNQQCRLLMNMFASIESGNIRAPLWDPSQGNFSNNQQYMREYVANLLATSFPNMTQYA